MTDTADRMRRAINSGDWPSNYLQCCALVADAMVLEERAAHITGGQLAGALVDIVKERARQDAKFGWIGAPGNGSILPGDNDWAKYAVLGEEVGEVARALLERDLGEDTTEHLEEELIQCAAVCVAWVQANREKASVIQTD